LRRPESKVIVAKLSCLFTLDAFAGGFVMQTIIVYWFKEKYGMDPDFLGLMMMGANVLAGVSALAAGPMVNKFGAINTMVFTHLPSNILLLLVPLMPDETSAVVMLLARFCISQMDVPARQAYVAMVVEPDERSAAGGITNIVRTIGLTISPLLVGLMVRNPSSFWFSMPFITSGALKVLYDVTLYYLFKRSSSAPISDPLKGSADAPSAASASRADDTGNDPERELDQLLVNGTEEDFRAHAALASRTAQEMEDDQLEFEAQHQSLGSPLRAQQQAEDAEL